MVLQELQDSLAQLEPQEHQDLPVTLDHPDLQGRLDPPETLDLQEILVLKGIREAMEHQESKGSQVQQDQLDFQVVQGKMDSLVRQEIKDLKVHLVLPEIQDRRVQPDQLARWDRLAHPVLWDNQDLKV